MSATYEVYAIKYGRHDNRKASENFIGGDPHDGPMPIDYYVWAIKGSDKTWVVDTGFDFVMAKKRERHVIRDPAEGLRLIDVDAARIEDVIITHFHYDHCGNHHLFANARYHVQDREMRYATGRCMCLPALRHAFSVEDVTKMVERVYDGRVAFHDGDEELAPGLSVHHVGGHTMGLQMVRVNTRRGWVVLASDASHYYEHFRSNRLFTTAYRLDDMIQAFRKVERLAASPDHIIPGHDPLVMQLYPAPTPALDGIIVRLDVMPNTAGQRAADAKQRTLA
jgi:glyoxylase-like metal-dependent hydrolase (beta-lactamase superfamily II)